MLFRLRWAFIGFLRRRFPKLERVLWIQVRQNKATLRVEKTTIFTARAMTILLLSLDHLGDFLLALPAISKLRAKYPYAAIDIVVGSWNVPLAEATGLFRAIYSFDFFAKKSSVAPKVQEAELNALLEQLGIYDIAIDMRRHGETRFFLARIQAGLKVGYQSFDKAIDAELHCVLPSFLNISHKVTPMNKTHTAEQKLALIDALPPDPNDFVRLPVLGQTQAARPGYVAIFPKAGNSVRDWEEPRFIELVTLLSHEETVAAITVYFASEQEAAAWVQVPTDKIQIRAGLAFPEFLSSVSQHSVCVANNSGGGHLAAYLGATVIAIYSGHVTVEEWAPPFGETYVIHRNAACAPCYHPDCALDLSCMRDIPVDFVFTKVMEAVQRKMPIIA
ncbi:MAG: glycosyltransferase family 9 protein [Zoogloeaceae bacterium]|jgi:ADP-heptose:LPS heptosyltransferase|nr:glycosyltransferase family 9 protein [Zoogloeaceae bacterium]